MKTYECVECWKARALSLGAECPDCIVREQGQDWLDMVRHPPHYTKWNIEVLDFIKDQKMDYIEGNIIKYVSRYKYKNWVEDLKKAEFYLNKLIKEYETKRAI